MTQVAKPIDLTTTFVPVDPQTFPVNMMSTDKQDSPTKSAPVVAYEGYNFLPTSYGYKSYFGTNSVFDIPALPTGVNLDKIFIVGTLAYTNFFVALCDTGIYVNEGGPADPWVQVVTLVAPVLPIHEQWTMAVIGNDLYFYRAKETSFWKMAANFTTAVVTMTSAYLNMTGQRGIFRAGSRLGFWDSMGSVAWSNIDDYEDYIPSVTTLAGSAIFSDVVGPIVTILPCGDGFVIYATNSITYIQRDLSSTFQWDPLVVLQGNGIAYQDQAITASPDTTHYAYTNLGLHKIVSGKIDKVITDTTDLLKESIYPISLKMLENRYLALQLIEAKFVEGLVEFDSTTYQPDPYVWPTDASLADIPSYLGTCDVSGMFSLGYFEEQQALAQAAIAASIASVGGFAMRTGSRATPIWEGQWLGRAPLVITDPDPITASNLTQEPTWFVTRTSAIAPWTITFSNPAFNAGIPAGGLIGLLAASPAVVASTTAEFTGATAIFDFCSGQKSMWDASSAEMLNFYNTYKSQQQAIVAANNGTGATGWCSFDPTYPNPVEGIAQFTPILIDHFESRFEISPCSVTAIETMAKGKAFMVATGLLSSDYAAECSGPKYKWNYQLQECDIELDISRQFNITSYCEIKSWSYVGTDGNTYVVPALTCDTGSMAVPYIAPAADCIPLGTPTVPNPWVTDPLDIPDFTINLQTGSPGPVYPVYAGALVYDTEYKKWGKMKCNYTQLLDLSPINTNQGKIVSTARFGITAAAVKPDRFIYRFDTKPADSYIKYGKIGYYRLGMTNLQEVRVGFRLPSTGTLIVDGSLDGRNPEATFTDTTTFTAATSAIAYPKITARWHTIKLTGNFDLTHLEYRGFISGRR